MADQQQPQQMQVKISDEVLRGSYSNALSVQHTKEEFVIDFMTLFPPNGIVGARVFSQPSSFKKMVAALTENLSRYEATFGKIEDAVKSDASSLTHTESNKIGFRAD
jgi:hypothetical protein